MGFARTYAILVLLLLLGVVLRISSTFAAESAEEEYPKLTYRPLWSVPLTLITAGTSAGLYFSESSLLPHHCRWCDRASTGQSDLNALDRSARNELRWSNRDLASNLSEVTAFALAPASALAAEILHYERNKNFHPFLIDSLVLLETLTTSFAVNEAVKIAAARERPSAHFAAVRTSRESPDEITSFYSRHANLAFTLAVASGTIASLRNYTEAPWIWASGITIAALTAYLRIAADAHYLSDTLMAAAAGSLVGFSIPYFLHHPSERKNEHAESFDFIATPNIEGGCTFAMNYHW